VLTTYVGKAVMCLAEGGDYNFGDVSRKRSFGPYTQRV